VSVYYLDTSAALKLLVDESDSAAFVQFYDAHSSASWVSSTLLRIELFRAVRRSLPQMLGDARELLTAVASVRIDDPIVESAMAETDPLLRSLDAIHLATARTLGPDLDGLATYDGRLAGAAARAGLPVVSPRT